jgi:enamine deaminase RidA (YjgF/YER057c/UK114 family)
VESETIVPEGFEPHVEQWGLAPAVRVGDTVYCSGQLGIAADGSMPADPEAQLVNAFEHIATVLGEAGATFADVVELTSFHIGLAPQLGVFTKVRDRYIGGAPPAQTAVGVAELGFPGAVVEIKATAVIGSASRGE